MLFSLPLADFTEQLLNTESQTFITELGHPKAAFAYSFSSSHTLTLRHSLKIDPALLHQKE